MTPREKGKLLKSVSAWIRKRQEEMSLSGNQMAELIGKQANTFSDYRNGKIIPPLDAILTIAYEADCTVEETQELFAAYANIRAGGRA